MTRKNKDVQERAQKLPELAEITPESHSRS